MDVQILTPESVPDPAALEALLSEYFAGILPLLAAAGGPEIPSAMFLDGLWDDIDAYLPPRGALVLATADRKLVGCAFLKRIREDAGELKRMYVHPSLRGTGLGRALLDARVAAARDLGLRDLYADTVKGNRAMLGLYESSGFRYISRYPENSSPPHLEPWMVFLHRELET